MPEERQSHIRSNYLFPGGDGVWHEPAEGHAMQSTWTDRKRLVSRACRGRPVCESSLAWLLLDKGDYAAAEPLSIEAAGLYEKTRLRMSTRGGLERVGWMGWGTPLKVLVAVHVWRVKSLDAWHQFEATFARALLDELALREMRPLTAAERLREDVLVGRLGKLDEHAAALLGRPDSKDRDELLAFYDFPT